MSSSHLHHLPLSPPQLTHAAPSLNPSQASINLRKHKFNSLDSLKSTYRSAAKAFLHNDHASVWLALVDGLQSTSALLLQSVPEHILPPAQPSWLPSDVRSPSYAAIDRFGAPDQAPRPIDDRIDEELRELARKFHVLRITFVASLSTPAAVASVRVLAAQHSGRARTLLEALVDLLARPPPQLLATLWVLVTAPDAALEAVLACDPPPPMAAPTLVGVHPSIVAAVALAALKLAVPSVGRQICEAWLASLTDGALDALVLALSVPESHATMRIASQGRGRPPNDVGAAYERLIEVYAIHILGALDEWDFAAGFLSGHSRDLGGPLGRSTVERLTDALRAQQAHHAHTAQVALQRHQRRLDRAQAQAQRAASVPPRPLPARASPSRHRSPPSQPRLAPRLPPARQPPSPSQQSSPAGFSALRANLSRLVAADSTLRGSPNLPPRPGMLEVLRLNLLAVVRAVLGAQAAQRVQQTRLLVIGLIGIMLLTKTVRRRVWQTAARTEQGPKGVLLANSNDAKKKAFVVLFVGRLWRKVLETVKMGTQISDLL